MFKSIILFIKGFIMGIANIIPGVSGGTLAIILGIYEDFIGALSHFFKNFKKNLIFILPVGIGMLASFATMSNVIDYSLHHYTLATVMFFVGLVLGGIPLLLNKVKVIVCKCKILSHEILFLGFYSLSIIFFSRIVNFPKIW